MNKKLVISLVIILSLILLSVSAFWIYNYQHQNKPQIAEISNVNIPGFLRSTTTPKNNDTYLKKDLQLRIKNDPNADDIVSLLNLMVKQGECTQEFVDDVLDASDENYDDSVWIEVFSEDEQFMFEYKYNTTPESAKITLQKEIENGNVAYVEEILNFCVFFHYFSQAEADYILGKTSEL